MVSMAEDRGKKIAIQANAKYLEVRVTIRISYSELNWGKQRGPEGLKTNPRQWW